MPLAIQTSHLSKTFLPDIGVFDVTLEVQEATIFAFLGPNGAGKTTTIRMLLGLLTPDSGEILIRGTSISDRARALTSVGSMVESPALYPNLTAVENLQISQILLGLRRSAIEDALALVGLIDDKDRLVRQFSLGMRQRLALAQALLGRPRLLILDEPSNGLDPSGIVETRALMRSLVDQEGVTIFLSSHLLEDVAKVATHVGVLARGRLKMAGEMTELQQRRLIVACSRPAEAVELLVTQGQFATTDSEGRLVLPEPTIQPNEVTRLLVVAGYEVTSIAWEANGLEEAFLALTVDEAAS